MGPAAQRYEISADQPLDGVLVSAPQTVEELCGGLRIRTRWQRGSGRSWSW